MVITPSFDCFRCIQSPTSTMPKLSLPSFSSPSPSKKTAHELDGDNAITSPTSSSSSEKLVLDRMSQVFREFGIVSRFSRAAAENWLQKAATDQRCARARQWFVGRLNSTIWSDDDESKEGRRKKRRRRPRAVPIDPLQKGCPEIIPGLRAKPFWDTDDLPWVKVIEDHFEVIRAELMSLRRDAPSSDEKNDDGNTSGALHTVTARCGGAANSSRNTNKSSHNDTSVSVVNNHGFQPYRAPSWTVKHRPPSSVRDGNETRRSANRMKDSSSVQRVDQTGRETVQLEAEAGQPDKVRGSGARCEAYDDNAGSRRRASDGVGATAHDRGNWNVCYLKLHNMDDIFQDNQKRCPQTMKLLGGERIGKLDSDRGTDGSSLSYPATAINYHHVFFSCASPNTHIIPHNGPTNKKLRCHLPLVVPEWPEEEQEEDTRVKREVVVGEGKGEEGVEEKEGGTQGGHRVKKEKKDARKKQAPCRIRVGTQIRAFEEGKCIVFDDSFSHEVWNDHPTKSRIVVCHASSPPPLLSVCVSLLLSFLTSLPYGYDYELSDPNLPASYLPACNMTFLLLNYSTLFIRIRMQLIFDVWHPDLDPREVKFLGFMQRSKLKMQRKLCKAYEEKREREREEGSKKERLRGREGVGDRGAQKKTNEEEKHVTVAAESTTSGAGVATSLSRTTTSVSLSGENGNQGEKKDGKQYREEAGEEGEVFGDDDVEEDTGDTFFSILERARSLKVDEQEIWN